MQSIRKSVYMNLQMWQVVALAQQMNSDRRVRLAAVEKDEKEVECELLVVV